MLFSDIYTKSIALFDDPKITVAYNTNKIQFYKLMYTYMQNAVMLFSNPTWIAEKLSNFTEAQGQMETFAGDGVHNQFTVTMQDIPANSIYQFVEGSIIVDGIYDPITNKVTFPDVLPIGQEYAFEYYFPGSLDDEMFNNSPNSNKGDTLIIHIVKDILARLLVKAWAESERNFLLDIRNIMQDADFKITGNDRILSAKNAWVDRLDTEVLQLQNKLSWNIRFLDGYKKKGRG